MTWHPFPVLEVLIDVIHPGEPVPKGRPRFGPGGGVYTPERTEKAEQAVAWTLRADLPAGHQPDSTSAFEVICGFAASDWRRRDVDNLTKLILDAANGIVWADDAQVVAVAAWVRRGHPHPQTRITIRRLDAPITPPRRPVRSRQANEAPAGAQQKSRRQSSEPARKAGAASAAG